jgi:hypothetical protein
MLAIVSVALLISRQDGDPNWNYRPFEQSLISTGINWGVNCYFIPSVLNYVSFCNVYNWCSKL